MTVDPAAHRSTEDRIASVDLTGIEPISGHLSVPYLENAQLVPVHIQERTLTVAAWLPKRDISQQVLDELQLLLNVEHLTVVYAAESVVREAIRRTYARSSVTASGVVNEVSQSPKRQQTRGSALDDLVQLANEAPVVRLVNLLLLEALDARASDIHLDHEANRLSVRYRVDGLLQEAPSPPSNLSAAVTSRIKIMAHLDIAERRLPQDGRIRLSLKDRDVDVRVSIVPSVEGESVVLRLLDADRARISLEDLGMPPTVRSQFQRAMLAAQGMILTTGPTGSGKTTTLYASVEWRQSGHEKILSVEDPVEYRIPGVTQIPVNDRIGLSFPVALRAILRQDPDVLLIGEIRDAATADIAVQAALTGHLVVSTMHTNDAPGALARLLDLGVAPYLIASTLELVLAQRLLRLSCVSCAAPTALSSVERSGFEGQHPPNTICRGAGCEACRGTGYRGRVGVYEMLVMSDELRTLVLSKQPASKFRTAAVRAGMISLRLAGEALVHAGLTTPEEISRVSRGTLS